MSQQKQDSQAVVQLVFSIIKPIDGKETQSAQNVAQEWSHRTIEDLRGLKLCTELLEHCFKDPEHLLKICGWLEKDSQERLAAVVSHSFQTERSYLTTFCLFVSAITALLKLFE